MRISSLTGVVCAALVAALALPGAPQAAAATGDAGNGKGHHQAPPTIPAAAPRPTLDKKVPPGAAATGSSSPASAKGAAAAPKAAPAKTAPDPLAAVHSAETADAAKAKSTGKPVAIPELTTERSTSVVNPDGTVSAAISLGPQRAWVNNAWAPIDTSLAKTATGWSPKAAPAQITLSPGGTGPLAVVGLQGKKVTVTWPLGALPAPQVSGGSAVYPQVLPGVDLRVTAGPEGIREVLVVADAHAAANPALRTLRFGVTGSGLSVKTDSSGALLAVDSKGKTVFGGDAPQMWDSSTIAEDHKAVANTTTAGSDASAPGIADQPDLGSKTAVMPIHLAGTTAELTPSQSLLTDPGTHYPVYIDPTIAMPTLYCREMFEGAPTITADCGDPTTSGNLNIMRAGYDPNSGSVGAVRSLFSFDVLNGLTGDNPYNGQPGGAVYDDPSVQPGNILSANLSLTVNSAPNCNGNLFDLYRTGPFVGPNWNSDGPNSAGAFGKEAIFLGQRSTSSCSQGGNMSIDDTAQVQSVFQSSFYGGGSGTASLGVRMANEEVAANNYWSFFFTRPGNASSSASLNVTYRPNPYVVANSLTTNPPMTTSVCQQELVNPSQPIFSSPPPTVGYIGKNFGNQVQLSAQLGDIDANGVYAQYQFADVTSGSGSNSLFFPSSGWYGDSAHGAQAAPGTMPIATITQNTTPLIDGHKYRFAAYVYDPNNGAVTEQNPACYFTVAFNAPQAPTITSAPDFSPLGTPAKSGMYATMASSAGISVQAQTAGVNIDHFEYIFNNDPSAIPATPAGANCANSGNSGCVSASTTGTALAGNTSTATIPVPAGITTFGTNSLWVRAVDAAGNVSPVGQYDFYLPGNPTATPTLGDITGDGVPDVLAVQPVDTTKLASATNPERLLTFPGNADPNVTGSVNQTVEAAPPTAAPDGVTWANTLISHRGALRGVPVDDLFAYSTTNKALYYYLNSDIFGGVVKTDMFAINQKVVVTRPQCTPGPTNGYCANGAYAPDWSKVTQILAFGNAAGTKPGTFAGRTNLITVEDDGNHNANVWMFSAGAGLGQLANPVLLSTGDTSKFNWLNADLVAPGANPGQTLPNLWARDRFTGNLWQLNNALNAAGVEDPTSLANQSAATQLGAKGAYGIDTYPTLFAGGRPNIAPGGTLAENGYPALWDVQNDGQLKFLPGAAGGPITTTGNTWQTTHTAWTSANAITSADGTAITAPSGPLLLGEGYTSGSPQLCMDLQSGVDNPNTPIWTWNCNGQSAQGWIINGDGTIRLGTDTTKCLEIATSVPPYQVLTQSGSAAGNWGANAGTMAGTPVQLNTCNDTNGQAAANQHWILRPSANAQSLNQNGWYDIYNPNSARCLDNGYDTTNTKQQLWIWDCLDNQAQQFQAPAAPGGWDNASAGVLASYPTTPPSTSTTINGDTYSLAATKVGDNYSLNWYIPYDGDYFIESTVGTGPGNGIMQASIDGGSTLPYSVDSYTANAGTAPAYYGAQHLTAGTHTFTFTVTGKNPASSGYQLVLTHMSLAPAHGTGPVSVLKTTPTPTNGVAPLAVSLDASQSYPGRNAISSYAFNFGDGTSVPAGTATTASHTYTAAGTYTASVTVTDSAGVTTTATQSVVVTVVPTGLTSADGTTTAACATTSASAATMASLTPTLSATVAPTQVAQFELRDLTDPSLTPPIAIGAAGSNGSSGPTSSTKAPTLVNGHEYAFAARANDGSGSISPISPTCYFWALTSGTQATATGAAGLPFDNTLYPANSPQTWTGPLTTLKWNNGDLDVYRNSDNALMWGAGVANANNVLALQNDGNIVIYSAQPSISITGWLSGTPVWSTNTSGQGATSALLAADGSFTVRKGTTVLWTAPMASHAWPLSDGQGLTAADNGFVGGSPAKLDNAGVSWQGGGYVGFAGTNRIATAAPVVDTTKSFTVSAWVNLATVGTGTQTMLVQQGTTNSAFYLEYNGSNWQFAMPTTDNASPTWTRITSTNAAAVGAWTHLIATYDSTSGRMALYVNGAPNSTGTIANSIASTGIFAMGRGFIGGVVNNRFKGSMADVRVFQQTVSDSQAASVYQSSSFAKPAVPGIAGSLVSGNSPAGDQICLDDLNGSLTNTTTVIDVYGCNGTWPQAWQFAADGTIRLMGANPAAPPNKCLDTGGVNTQGSKVTLFDCQPGNGNQQWKAVPSSSTPGQYSLQNPPTGMCLDNSNGATNNTNPFQLYSCLDNANQHFTLPTASGQDQKAEGESLWGSAAGGGTMQIQTGSEYSNGAQEFMGSTASGASMTLNMYVANPGSYAVTPLMTMAADYGIVSVSVDGAAALPLTFDGFGSGITTKQFDFGGTVNLTAGMHAFTFTVTGTNTASTGNRYNLGVDTLILQPTAR
ncbi:ricin-type beta-trefoil lectin domain protein [Catenulispora sp. EB89]|uniref:ricin-type beta-trefoil lectin domain protein n=1 Tax=Catenulispora sp. EB89 TaxID=3156257 RepID=UPI00351888AE